MVQWLALWPHGKKVADLIPGLGPFCVEFACSPCVIVGSLQLPPTVQKHARGGELGT